MSYLEELLPEFRKGAKIRSSMWSKKAFIHLKDGKILDESGLPYTIPAIAFHINDWELYQEPVDWERIINDRCLCWLWDDNFKWAICGTLANVEKGSEYRFIMSDDAGNRSSYKHCRPVRRDEISFYNEKENTDEQ